MRNFIKPAGFLLLIFAGCTTRDIPAPALGQDTSSVHSKAPADTTAKLDSADYDNRLLALSNGDTTGRWPVKSVYPIAGAILPFKRIVAYYGNYYSKSMGVLGELPEEQMLEKLETEVDKWEKADTNTPVQPALHYIAVTAQQNPGKAGKYRLQMPFSEIDKSLELAKKIGAIVILDIQVGTSTLQQELPRLDDYLKLPNVHLGIDPEFSMKTGASPGSKVGTFDAEDINYAARYLAGLVKLFDLPPKVLIVHRFTKKMVTNYKEIKPLPEVQIVMQMDGWGGPAKKTTTYRQTIYREPVQFTGFKIFYKHDTKRVNMKQEMQPEDILKLVPRPIYIQYQ